MQPSSVEDDGRWGPGDGRTTIDFLRDPLGRTSRVVRDDDYRVLVRRDPEGNVVAVTDGLDELRIEYADGSTVASELRLTPPDPQATPFVLRSRVVRDDYQRPVRILDTWGNAIDVEYRQNDRTIVVYDPAGPDSTDVFNNRPVNARGNQTRFTFDGGYRLEGVETDLTRGGVGGAPLAPHPVYNPSGRMSVRYRYEDDKTSAVIDADGNEYHLLHEGGRFAGIRYPPSLAAPAGCAATIEYDIGTGRAQIVRDANGTTFMVTYDSVRGDLIRDIRVTFHAAGVSGTNGYSFDYDGAGRMISALNLGTLDALAFEYDSDGCALVQRQGPTVTSAFYQGRRTRLQYPDGSAFRFRYPDQHLFIESGTSTEAEYDLYGAYAREAFHRRRCGPLTMMVQYRPDAALRKLEYSGLAGNVSLRWDAQDPADPTNPEALRLDRQGRFTGWTRIAGMASPPPSLPPLIESREWTRDSAGRIETEVDTRNQGIPNRIETERVFDVLSVRREQVMRSYDGVALIAHTRVVRTREERGRIIDEDTYDDLAGGALVGHHRFQYDRAGNLLNDGTYEYAYDAFGRLIYVRDRRLDNVTRYEWDAIGRRTRAIYQWVEPPFQFSERYVYDGSNLIQVRIGPDVVEEYAWGRLQGELLWIGIRRGGTFRVWAIQRPDGSVDSLVGSDGRIVESYDYTLDGARSILSGLRIPAPSPAPVRDLPNGPMQRIGFLGHVHDPYTGLVFFGGGGRVYSPRLGLLLTPEPDAIGRLGNAYVLANHDPIGAGNPRMLGTAPDGTHDDGSFDWGTAIFAGAIALTVVLGVGLLAIGALAFAVGVGVLSTGGAVAIAAVGLVTGWGVSALARSALSGESAGTAIAGGLLDVTGASDAWQAVMLRDFASGAEVHLSDDERGARIGGALTRTFSVCALAPNTSRSPPAIRRQRRLPASPC